MDKFLSGEVCHFHLLDLGSLLLIFLFSFISLTSLQHSSFPSSSFLLFNFFSMALIWENFYAIVLDGVVKHLEEFGCDGIDGFALGQR
jgi:hypothetical protein